MGGSLADEKWNKSGTAGREKLGAFKFKKGERKKKLEPPIIEYDSQSKEEARPLKRAPRAALKKNKTAPEIR